MFPVRIGPPERTSRCCNCLATFCVRVCGTHENTIKPSADDATQSPAMYLAMQPRQHEGRRGGERGDGTRQPVKCSGRVGEGRQRPAHLALSVRGSLERQRPVGPMVFPIQSTRVAQHLLSRSTTPQRTLCRLTVCTHGGRTRPHLRLTRCPVSSCSFAAPCPPAISHTRLTILNCRCLPQDNDSAGWPSLMGARLMVDQRH